MAGILIIEDNTDVNHMLAESLRQAGYVASSEYRGDTGLAAARAKPFDLILLDIMLPYKSGDVVLRELRGFSDVPVIVLSAKDMVDTKINLLQLGADDYVTKPFDLGEVAARVEAALRRFHKQGPPEEILRHRDLALDNTTKIVQAQGREVDLTAKEFLLLATLMANPTKVFTKANLFEAVWEESYLNDDNAVKTHISNLRAKLKAVNPQGEYIETVWGLGYRMCKG